MADVLIGKKITKAFVNADKTIVKLKHDDGGFIDLVTEADCCSETWIEHASNIEGMIGNVIEGTEEVDLGEVMSTRQECDLLYAFKIKHDGAMWGDCGFEFRNSSNGYYGGSMRVSIGDADLDGFTEIKEDF